MVRVVAAALAAQMLGAEMEPAVGAPAPAAEPFAVIPIASERQPSHRWAYASLALGAGAIALSFDLSSRANRTYDEYQSATEISEIERLYDRTTHYDRWSSAALIGGQVLIAGGLYLRFLKRPRSSRMSVELDASRCAAVWRF